MLHVMKTKKDKQWHTYIPFGAKNPKKEWKIHMSVSMSFGRLNSFESYTKLVILESARSFFATLRLNWIIYSGVYVLWSTCWLTASVELVYFSNERFFKVLKNDYFDAFAIINIYLKAFVVSRDAASHTFADRIPYF